MNGQEINTANKIPAYQADGKGGVKVVEIDEPPEVAAERSRQEWLLSAREKYQAMQDEIAAARTAFLTLKGRYDALEAWARTKGYTE